MSPALSLGLGVVAVLLAVPCAIFAIECFLAVLPGGKRPLPTGANPDPEAATGPGVRFALLVPAHDEAAVIGETLRSLTAELGPRDRMLVVADNCTDDTASLAHQAGAEVAERADPERRGKGYALAFGLERLAADPPDVVIVFDADCWVASGSLRLLAEQARAAHRPVQADYLLSPPGSPSPLALVSAFAFLVRNRVRPLGLARLGMPCHLTGTGMAFPWDVIRLAPPLGSSLVEDLLMGIELAIMGYAPIYSGDVRVVSVLPDGKKAARGQRKRWEHGQLATLRTKAPGLIIRGIATLRPRLLALGLDLLVPPLALLVGMLVVAFLLTGAASFWLHASWFAPEVVGISLVVVGAAVVLAWLRFALRVIRPVQMLMIPFYLLWKVPLYLSLLIRGRQRTWERTERSAKEVE
jgi:cellulose synthase/poly-beta-1,6-N-acetylglucosamine synthase-like glycosyltransferase